MIRDMIAENKQSNKKIEEFNENITRQFAGQVAQMDGFTDKVNQFDERL